MTKEEQKQLDDLQAKVAILEADKTAQAELISDLESKLEAKADQVRVNRPVVTIDKQKYAVMGAAFIEGKRYTREQISESGELQSVLLKNKSGILVPLAQIETPKKGGKK